MRGEQRYWNDPAEIVTGGSWATEQEAEEDLVAFLAGTRLFSIYQQPTGTPIVRRPFQTESKGQLRADLLLTPKRRLIQQGWAFGSIIIDVKRSGIKIGPGLNQLIDYLGTAWRVVGGTAVLADFALLFPARCPGGPLASIMAHQHVGGANLQYGRLNMYCGHSRVMAIEPSGEVRIGRMDFGHKLGSR
ncbi:MAG: hypothetical protein ACOC8E_06910 [Planctomycetota bacterium]